MFGYSLKHPIKKANHLIRNNQELTSLTLSCKLGRDTMFQDMLEMSCVEFWRYSNITCCGYPLGMKRDFWLRQEPKESLSLSVCLSVTKCFLSQS